MFMKVWITVNKPVTLLLTQWLYFIGIYKIHLSLNSKHIAFKHKVAPSMIIHIIILFLL